MTIEFEIPDLDTADTEPCGAPEDSDDQPEMQCPKCKAWLPDFDGFGVLAHTKPAYADGCGYCSHPALADGVCEICGVRP